MFDGISIPDEDIPLNIVVSRLLKRNGHELMFDLPSEAKAESLIPILLDSCLHLPSSPYKHAF
jgi:hypothetical protein